MTAMPTSFTRKVALGVAWMTSARALVRLMGLVSMIVLARLLNPTDFGIVAMAMAVAAGLELLTLFSFDMALIQRKEMTRALYDSAWTLNFLMGVGLAAALAVAAGPVAVFYREPRLDTVMLIIGAKYIIDGAINTGTVDFRRNLDFQSEFVLQLVPRIAGILVTIPLAFWLSDYRALLAGMLFGASIACMMSYVMHPHRPRWCLSEARGLIRFSRWLLLNNFVGFLWNRGADFIIGRALGPASLGIYSLAYEVSNLPSTEMVAPINRVLFPSYVQLADDFERLREGFRATLGLIALVILPASIGLAAVAEPLVRVVLGNKWLETIPLISLLAVAGAGTVLQSNTGSVYNALGQPRMIALTGAIHAALLIPMILFATYTFGLIGTAWAVLVHSLALGMTTTYGIFLRTTPIRLADVLQACWRPIIACAVMFGSVRVFLAALEPYRDFIWTLGALLAACAIGVLTYAAAIALLWLVAGRPQGAETMVLGYIEPVWRRLTGTNAES